MQWADLFAAIAVLLVLEGILPFLLPATTRALVRKLETMNNTQLRTAGFISMIIGITLLSIVR